MGFLRPPDGIKYMLKAMVQSAVTPQTTVGHTVNHNWKSVLTAKVRDRSLIIKR